MYDYAVVGNGMIGSAAGRYLSQGSKSVVMIGPDEPQGDWRAHDGVFASHYDQGRITRGLDGSIEWAIWAQRSLAAYAELEAKSGIKFYHPGGCIQVGLVDGDYIPRTETVALHLGTAYQKHSGSAFGTVHPELKFSDEYVVLYEPNVAGYVNPRQLVQAQLTVAQQQGATIVRETVTAIEPQTAGVLLTTDAGQTIQTRKVLVAAGAWTEFLTGIDLGLIPTPRTIVLARLDAAETDRLKNMPAIVFYEGVPNPHISGVYLLPPIRYPDGHTYLKIGGVPHQINVPQSAAELQAWFHSDGSSFEAQELERILFNVVDGLRAESLHVNTCVVTNQKAENLPVIKTIVPERVMVATAGCGAAAKSSNELGRIAATRLRQSDSGV